MHLFYRWFERLTMTVILFNCVTLGMYQPCEDNDCVTQRCKVLRVSNCILGNLCKFCFDDQLHYKFKLFYWSCLSGL